MAKIGSQLQTWFPVDRMRSVVNDGSTLWILPKKLGRWTPEVDVKLEEAVTKYGNDWVAVAKIVAGRANVQCRERWNNTVDPANHWKNLGKWTPAEDAKLVNAVKKHSKDGWVAVAAMVTSRTYIQCRQRWVGNLDPAKRKKPGKWSTQEGTKLKEAVKKHGKDWVAVADLVPGRSNAQWRERWIDTMDPANRGKKLGRWKRKAGGSGNETWQRLDGSCQNSCWSKQ
jgi:myb proto-oncogene protein